MDFLDAKPPNPPGYYDTGEHAFKERTLDTYISMIFRDSTKNWMAKRTEAMTPDNPMLWSLRHSHRIDHFFSSTDQLIIDSQVQYDWDWKNQTIFGGLDNFFIENASILDLGSGHGQVVQEINQRYSSKHVSCIGLDYRYHYDRPAVTRNLVGGEFEKLPFPDKSFNRLLSVESFPAWLPKDKNLITSYFDEITRVSKQGTIWRGTLPTYDEFEKPFISSEELVLEFTKRGWELVVDNGGNRSFIAQLVN